MVTAEGGRPRPSRAAAADKADMPDMVAGVRLTHPEKVMYAGQGLTKRGLADYYEAVAPVLLPHIAHRPLSIVRCPSGRIQQCFYQKHHGNGVEGKGIRPIPLAEEKGKADYISIDGIEGLILLVQLGVLELHPWGSRTDDPEHPDRLTLDLDPDVGMPWEEVVSAAEEVRARLSDLGLVSFVKTTGGKGLHVVVPIARRHGWDVGRAFTEALAAAMAKDSPGRYVTTVAKRARTGKIFVDFLRNDRGATAVGAYSTRAREGAPVSTPVDWDELAGLGRADRFTVENVPRRLAGGGDPWAEMGKVRQSLTAKALKGVGLKLVG
jgi:bifunctional non-homologous end joining protein LigD